MMNGLARVLFAALALLAGPSAPALAQSAAAGAMVQTLPPGGDEFASYLDSLRPKARALGVRDATMDALFATLTPNPRVVQLDRNQPGGAMDTPIPDFAPYRRKHVTARLIADGQATWRANRARLAGIEARTGVPEALMVAILGHETNYGSYMGDFDVLRSLATLAHEGRRRRLFEPELLATLKIIEGGVPRGKLVGSWAGAMGYPQFLPTVYLRDGRDGDGDGKVDIWGSQADALASIATYFVNAGWRQGEPWGVAVKVPDGFDRNAVAGRMVPQRCPRVFGRHSRWLTGAEWKRRGIVMSGAAAIGDDMLASLLEPDGPGQTAYLLTGNYRVILDYNCSNFYALSVGLLADAVDD